MFVRRMVVVTVYRMLDMFRTCPTGFSEESQEHQAPRIEAGQQSRQNANRKAVHMIGRTAGKRALDNRVFRIETGKAADADYANSGNRQRACHHCPEGQRDRFTQAAIITHVLLVMHRVNDRTGAQEEQSLEEGMREQMEHGHTIGPAARCKEHVSELRTGRIGDDALDVVLNKPNSRGENRGGCAHNGDDIQCKLTGFKQRRQAADHEHASSDHRRSMDQR
jgi:hypothetical protein